MKRALKITTNKLQESDRKYWLTKSPQELVDAIELLREQYVKFKYKNVQPGFQRFCRVVNQK